MPADPPSHAPKAPEPLAPPGSDEGQGTVVAERQEQRVEPPKLYQVVMLNDDYTPMEFVVLMLQEYFLRDIDTATLIMLKIHHEGRGVCGVYSKETGRRYRAPYRPAVSKGTRPAGISGRLREKSRALLNTGMRAANLCAVQACTQRVRWPLSCCASQRHHVFRASVLSIVLTLAVGPNAALLCGTWCDQQAAAPGGCPHSDQAAAPGMGRNDICDTVVLGAALLGEGERRGVPSPDGDRAIPVLRSAVARSATDARLGHEPGREWSLDKRPLPTILRI